MKALAKALTIMAFLGSACYLTMNCHRQMAAGVLFVCLVAVILMPDGE